MEIVLNTQVTRCITHRSRHSFKVGLLYLWSLVYDQDLRTVAAECPLAEALNITAVLECTLALTRADLHRVIVPGAVQLPQNLRIPAEVIIDFLRHKHGLLCRTGNDRNVASRIKYRHSDTTDGGDPRLTEATALHIHDRIIPTKNTGLYALYRP